MPKKKPSSRALVPSAPKYYSIAESRRQSMAQLGFAYERQISRFPVGRWRPVLFGWTALILAAAEVCRAARFLLIPLGLALAGAPFLYGGSTLRRGLLSILGRQGDLCTEPACRDRWRNRSVRSVDHEVGLAHPARWDRANQRLQHGNEIIVRRASRRNHHDRIIGRDSLLRILEHAQPVGLDSAIAGKSRDDIDVTIGERAIHESRLEFTPFAEPQALAVAKTGPFRAREELVITADAQARCIAREIGY